jgi:hypothetical protein
MLQGLHRRGSAVVGGPDGLAWVYTYLAGVGCFAWLEWSISSRSMVATMGRNDVRIALSTAFSSCPLDY